MLHTRIFITMILMTFLVACAHHQPLTAEEQKMRSASQSCLKQAREMTNTALNMAEAPENDYFTMCMQTQYGYTWKQVQEMPL